MNSTCSLAGDDGRADQVLVAGGLDLDSERTLRKEGRRCLD
jgi:hypothetical protein